MNCRRAQSDIALWAGNDLDETDLQCLQRHLEACPECQKYQEQMHALMRLVEECPLRDEADEASKLAVEDSLWPSLASRLATFPKPRSDHFNGWVPAVAVAAVCLAMVLIASPPHASSTPETPHTSVSRDSGWSGEVQTTDFSETMPHRAPQRTQEPIQLLPVGGNPVQSRLRNPYEFPRFSTPPEIKRELRDLDRIHSRVMEYHGYSHRP